MSADPREIEIPILELLPIQARASRYQMEFIRRIGKIAQPVDVVLYEGEPDTEDARYLLVDGMHRTLLNLEEGEEAVKAYAMETDEQVAKSFSLGFMHKCKSLDDARKRYRSVWLPKLEEKGVTGIETVEIYRGWRN